jgi:hypothetical protein
LLGIDLGDVVDTDQEPRSPEQASADFECFGLVCCFAVADAGDAADPFGRGLDEKALAAAKPVAAAGPPRQARLGPSATSSSRSTPDSRTVVLRLGTAEPTPQPPTFGPA